ncbi:unnamed protein product [Heligmosomoides polygyrus]|uniref:Uncharacterized protein n=1 Tax=Heligmosomoides polygyrus TaxID=6339 RepID=A0A183F806_HELPZ|nr:unnamed protein product [Heligmosomoides polygyrus]
MAVFVNAKELFDVFTLATASLGESVKIALTIARFQFFADIVSPQASLLVDPTPSRLRCAEFEACSPGYASIASSQFRRQLLSSATECER